ncbi:MAG: hypothetical protein AAB389_04320, partial [Patescibacteria group bacterium]
FPLVSAKCLRLKAPLLRMMPPRIAWAPSRMKMRLSSVIREVTLRVDLLLSSDPSLIEDFSTHLAEALKK